MVKTVRVANPADPTQFMTINASDYRVAVHGELWPDQHPDFDGIPDPVPQRMDPAVRDLAAGLMFNVLDMEAVSRNGTAFSSLSPVQQLNLLRDKRNEFEEAKTRFFRERQVSDKERGELRQGFSSEPDLREVSRRNTEQGTEPAQSPAPAAQPPAAPPAPPAPLAPAEKAPEAPAGAPWATKAAAPAAPPAPPPAKPNLTVEKGPGSKWFVMDGKEPKSAGFPTKAEAEKELTKLQSAE